RRQRARLGVQLLKVPAALVARSQAIGHLVVEADRAPARRQAATPGGAAFQVVAGRLAQHKRLQRLGDDGYQAYLRKFVRLLAHGLRLWSGDRALDRRAGIDADGRLAPLRAI